MPDSHPVFVQVQRADGSLEKVRVGNAVRDGEDFVLTLGQLVIGGTAEAPRRAAPAMSGGGGAGGGSGEVFPPYGRSKGAPVRGATMGDLEYYASGCRRTLTDPAKSRWHDKERSLLAAIEAEIERQGGTAGGMDSPAPPRRAAAPAFDDEAPPPSDDDIPF